MGENVKRAVLHFSVRCYSEIPLADMAQKVGAALGCDFREEDFNDSPAFVARFLGLKVHLNDWRGLGDRVVFILGSMLAEDRFLDTPDGSDVDLEIIEIGSVISDLLTVSEAGDWHPATDEEAAAEREHGGRIAERIRRQEEEGATWDTRWRPR